MIDIKTIKANARAQLGNNIFSNFWLMMLVCGLISGVITSVASSFVVGTIIVIGPLSFGLARVSVKRACGAPNVDIGDVFKGFTDNFVNSLVLGIMQSLFIALWSLLFVIPGIVKSISYSMAFYIKRDNPNMTANEAITESRRLMDGNKMRLFLLNLSFIGWIFLGALTFGIGTLWVSAYMETSLAIFYEDVKASKPRVESGIVA